jgi:hypothetical protein
VKDGNGEAMLEMSVKRKECVYHSRTGPITCFTAIYEGPLGEYAPRELQRSN